MGMISRADGFMVWLCPHAWSFVAPGFGLSVARTPLPKSPLRLLAWRWMCWGAEGSRVVSTWAEESWWRWRICREGLELVRKLWPKCWGPSRAGRAGQGWACPGKGERGSVFAGSGRRGGKSLSLPSDLSLAASVAWEGGSRIKGCSVGCWGTHTAQPLAQ